MPRAPRTNSKQQQQKAPETRLMTLAAVSAPGLEGLPERLVVLPWGQNDTAKGPVILNSTSLAAFPGYMKKQNWDRVPVDFNHNTVRGTPDYDPAGKIAGYGTIELVEGEGAVLTMTSWTADGKELAGGGHFADVSATVILNSANEVIGIHSVALCRHGAAAGAVFLSSDWEQPENKVPETPEELFQALRMALKLPDDAQPQEVAVALATAMAAQKAAPDDKTDPNKPTENNNTDMETTALAEELSSLKALVTGLAAKLDESVTTLSTSVKDLADNRESSERTLILSTAAREGKVVPNSAKALPLDTLRTLCSELPVTVPMELSPSTVLPLSSDGQPIINPEIAKKAGVSVDDIKKYGSQAKA